MQPMLYKFLKANHEQVIRNCEAKMSARLGPLAPGMLEQGIPRFLDQLIDALHHADQGTALIGAALADGGVPGTPYCHPDISIAAALHGQDMLERGYGVDEVVHSYGDLCQTISELALQQGIFMDASEFRVLNRCLDNAIAHAVTEFSYQRDFLTATTLASREHARLDELAGELRNLLGTASLAVSALKARDLPLGGATGTILERSLESVGDAVERLLRSAGATQLDVEMLNVFSLRDFMQQAVGSAAKPAAALGRRLALTDCAPDLAVKGNRDSLRAVLGSLLQTAFALSAQDADIAIRAYGLAQEVRIEIAWPCGTIPEQGLDPGLTIARELLQAEHGELLTQVNTAHGCTLTISLPRHAMPT